MTRVKSAFRSRDLHMKPSMQALNLPMYTRAALLLALAATACTTALPAPAPTLTHAEALRGCALGLSGSSVTPEDTAEGMMLTFRSSDRIEEMRERARDAAAQHGPSSVGHGHDGRHGEGGEHGLKLLQAPPARSAAVDVPGGAQIQFVPSHAGDLVELREKLRARADAMNASTCK